MEFRVLGSLAVHRDGQPVEIRSHRQRLLLATLLIEANRVVSVDALTLALWGDRPPAGPRNAIQTHMARLREALGGQAPIDTCSPGYCLRVEPEQVDALRFEQLLAEAGPPEIDPARARRLLDEALEAWRGEPYAEFADGVALAESRRLSELRLRALEERAAARLSLGEAGGVVGELEALVSEHPLRERFPELLMRALAAVDRQAEALEAYQQYRRRLADETGLEPSPSLRTLEDRILRGELAAPARSTSSGAARSTAAQPPRSLPAPPAVPTPLVGRHEEIARVRVALDREQVVTLTGTGGVGKTRIASEVATAIQRERAGEVAWVELASTADPTALPYVLATALGVDLSSELPPREALLQALSATPLLVVLDNCEHLLDALAPLVDAVRRRCPKVRVLATSRERLAVEGESIVPVAPLAVDGDDGRASEAVALFLQRAASADPRLDLSRHSLTVAAVCRELDGLPLAIELAAARTGALPLEDLLAALRADTPAAVGTRRGSEPRHRDLWSVVEWSYRMLGTAEQRLFDRLSVFAGAFSVDTAHAVCAPAGQSRSVTLEHLATLSERSLLTCVHEGSGSGPGRYRMLLTLRAFARQRLADSGRASELADRHAETLTRETEQATAPPMRHSDRRWVAATLDDLRQVRRRAVLTGDVDVLSRLVAALYRFDYWRPGAELLGWADDALALDGVERHPCAPQVHAAAAAAAWMRGDLERSRGLATRAVGLGAGPDDPARTLAFEAVGDVATFEGRFADAEAAFREQARLARLGDDPDYEALALAGMAAALAYAGRSVEAMTAADAAGRAAAGAGPVAQSFVRYMQGECRAETTPEDAVGLVEEAAAQARDCEAWFVDGVARLTAASVRARHGSPTKAVPVFADLLRRWRRSGNWTQQWITVRNLPELLVRLGIDEPAVVVASATQLRSSPSPGSGEESKRLDETMATAQARLDPEAFAAAQARGAAMGAEELLEFALETLDGVGGRHRRGMVVGQPAVGDP